VDHPRRARFGSAELTAFASWGCLEKKHNHSLAQVRAHKEETDDYTQYLANLTLISLGVGLNIQPGLAHWVAVGDGRRPPDVALAQGTTRYVAPAPTGNDSGNDCTSSSTPCATVQHAVDLADPGDEIRVTTGTYSSVQGRPVPAGYPAPPASGTITQVVYISKTVTLRGGYTTTNWTTPYPITQPTTLDAQRRGRVLYITGDISPTVEGLRITGGDAVGLGGSPSGDSGGGVLAISATITMSNNQIFSNTATFGGGLYFYVNTNVMLIDNTISDNRGWTHAGGLYFRNSSGATLIGNMISDNESPPPAGYFGGARFVHSDNATLTNNIISGNHAADQCGGVCFDTSSNALLTGNTVISNSAGTPGFVSRAGGLRFISSNGANLISNTVTNNSTFGSGGGLYLERSDITMINNVIVDNQITITSNFTGSGSGLYIAGSSPRLLHTTVARNSGGDGSGVYITDAFDYFNSNVALTNTIFADHSVGTTVTAGNTTTLNGVLWYSNTINYGGEGYITVTNEYTGDPAFAADGYHLTCASAAIDRGVNAGMDNDIDGDPRPRGGGYDLGADEINCIYLPIILKNSG
jgi:parallel beta-helix repeat protein